VKASNSCVRTLIFGSFLLLSFVKFFSLPLFRFLDLGFYRLFSFFYLILLSSFIFPALVLYLFLCGFSLAYPNLLENKKAWLLLLLLHHGYGRPFKYTGDLIFYITVGILLTILLFII
jgi:hypothetical protein